MLTLVVLGGVLLSGVKLSFPTAGGGSRSPSATSVGMTDATSGVTGQHTRRPPAAGPRVEPATPDAAPSARPSGTPAADRPQVPIVPVVSFWSSHSAISLSELRTAIETGDGRFDAVVLPTDEAEAIADTLGVADGVALRTDNRAGIRRQVRDGALGLLRLDDVTPAVRALALEGVSLFGNQRVDDVGDWPLRVADLRPARDTWTQADTWTLVAGGDLQLDRRMAYQVTTLGRGVDFPFDGGTVRITGRECCGRFGHHVPVWEATGNQGAVRRLFADADLAMANLEAAAVRDEALHGLSPDFRDSLSFSGDPRLLAGLDEAGFDFVSLANNHIHNGGARGIDDTRDALDELGVAHAGAGRDLEAARQPAVLDAGGPTVAVLTCTTVGSMAGRDRPGARPCHDGELLDHVAAAAREADVVVVFPHWGREYRSDPLASQQRLADAWIEAGADLVLGAHAHWVGAIEEIDDRLVFYSLGNLTFDQPWSEPTMQGLIVELTFGGAELVQAWLHPTLIVDDVQPNLLEPAGGGEKVLTRMRRASEGLLDY